METPEQAKTRRINNAKNMAASRNMETPEQAESRRIIWKHLNKQRAGGEEYVNGQSPSPNGGRWLYQYVSMYIRAHIRGQSPSPNGGGGCTST